MIQLWSRVHNTRRRAWKRPGAVESRPGPRGDGGPAGFGYVGPGARETAGRTRAAAGFSAEGAEPLLSTAQPARTVSAQRRVPAGDPGLSAAARAVIPGSRPLRASYRVPSFDTASYQEAVPD